ncbi:Hypothetical predicted protein [Xyrichtys novacula]|uniref:Uncharacterized protein n=1 Tax=Xyrichtys novacula TaxID=13765 RepID=A0AAV1ENF4_XYRNO|nr:Hypothetical predicted protein [Xyrichtys novacula]
MVAALTCFTLVLNSSLIMKRQTSQQQLSLFLQGNRGNVDCGSGLKEDRESIWRDQKQAGVSSPASSSAAALISQTAEGNKQGRGLITHSFMSQPVPAPPSFLVPYCPPPAPLFLCGFCSRHDVALGIRGLCLQLSVTAWR